MYAAIALHELPEEPHQPVNFSFPERSFGQTCVLQLPCIAASRASDLVSGITSYVIWRFSCYLIDVEF